MSLEGSKKVIDQNRSIPLNTQQLITDRPTQMDYWTTLPLMEAGETGEREAGQTGEREACETGAGVCVSLQGSLRWRLLRQNKSLTEDESWENV